MAKLEKILEYIDDSILKRAFLFLEEGDWVKANAYLEEVLNQNPENGLAYLGKLMIDTQVHTCVELMDLASPFDENLNYKRCIRYVEEEVAEELKGYNVYIKERNAIVGNATAYNEALKLMNNAKSEEDYNRASAIFKKLGNYENSAQLAEECLERIEQLKIDIEFNKAEKYFAFSKNEEDFIEAAHMYESIAEQCDVRDKIDLCYQKAEEARQEKIKAKQHLKESIKLVKKIIFGVITLVIMGFSAMYIYDNFFRYSSLKQAKAGDLVRFGSYTGNRIVWKVCEIQGSRKLLISEYALIQKPIDSTVTEEILSWENCQLRQWLNYEFYKDAFDISEKKIIKLTDLYNEVDDKNNTFPSDLVFLLSTDEVKRYLGSDSIRCQLYGEKKEYISWWTRTSGNGSRFFAFVENKHVNMEGGYGYSLSLGIRPALWVNTESTSADWDLFLIKERSRKEKIRLAEDAERLRIEEEKREAERLIEAALLRPQKKGLRQAMEVLDRITKEEQRINE